MKHILPTELINKVIAYLASKTFSEVASLIHDLQTQAVPAPDSMESK